MIMHMRGNKHKFTSGIDPLIHTLMSLRFVSLSPRLIITFVHVDAFSSLLKDDTVKT